MSLSGDRRFSRNIFVVFFKDKTIMVPLSLFIGDVLYDSNSFESWNVLLFLSIQRALGISIMIRFSSLSKSILKSVL